MSNAKNILFRKLIEKKVRTFFAEKNVRTLCTIAKTLNRVMLRKRNGRGIERGGINNWAMGKRKMRGKR